MLVVFINSKEKSDANLFIENVSELWKFTRKITFIDKTKEALRTLGWNGAKNEDIERIIYYMTEFANKKFNMNRKTLNSEVSKCSVQDILFVYVVKNNDVIKLSEWLDDIKIRHISVSLDDESNNYDYYFNKDDYKNFLEEIVIMDIEEQKKFVKQKPENIQYIKNPSEEVCLAAVKTNGYALKYVQNQTDKVCIEAIKNYCFATDFVKIMTPTIREFLESNSGLSSINFF